MAAFNMIQNILIVEDEHKISDVLADYFRAEGYHCEQLDRGDRVAGFLRTHSPDLILLDLQLPGRNGMEVCRDIRKDSDIPIIMVTAKVDEIDRLLGLELGADDYICKPFSPREVVARAKAVLRRCTPQVSGNSSRFGRLEIQHASRIAQVDEQPLTLTPLEFDLLALFVSRATEVLSRQQLLAHGQGSQFEGYERNIDSHMKNLRRKLKTVLNQNDPFRTVYGVGYGLNAAAFESDPHAQN